MQALEFYKYMRFHIEGDLNGTGKEYPILHMVLH